MAYFVKELFYTLQGEGVNAGRPAVFCRFTGCNLWSGKDEDRSRAICQFCDTDFVGTDGPGGGRFDSAMHLADAVRRTWPTDTSPSRRPLVVFTGGEPALQLDSVLLGEVQSRGFEVAVETNGTIPLPRGVDWVCVSPKAGTTLAINRGHEMKLVFPQDGSEPDQYRALDFDHFFLQPMDGPSAEENTQRAVEYCLANPPWRLSFQTHKILGIR